jgi:hypothetical protein
MMMRPAVAAIVRVEIKPEHINSSPRPTWCLARRRMLDHYLHTAHAANRLLHPIYEQIIIAAALPGVVAEQLTDGTAALAWFEAEYAVLLAAVQLAADTGLDSHAWQLPHDLMEFCGRRGHWADWAAIERIALSAAQRHGNRVL